MTNYTYLTADIDGTIRDEIPFSKISFSNELSRASGMSGEVHIDPYQLEHLTDIAVPNRITESNLDLCRTVLWILRNGIPVWGGFLWSFEADLESQKVSFAGGDFWDYYHRRLFNVTKGYYGEAGYSLYTIIEDAITYAKSVTGGNIGTTVVRSPNVTTPFKDMPVFYYDKKFIGPEIEALCGRQNGADFAIDYTGSVASGLHHQLTLSYPSRGRNTSIVFDASKNVRLLKWSKDGTIMVNEMWARGAGQASEMLLASRTDTDALTRYPLLQGVRDYQSVQLSSTLNAHAVNDLKSYKKPLEVISLEVAPDDPDSGLGSYILGDTVTVVASKGFIQINGRYRIMKQSVDVDENGLESVKLELKSPEATLS